MRYLLAVILALAVTGGVQSTSAATRSGLAVHPLRLNPESAMPVYGTYRVFWKTGAGGWKQAGELGFDNYYRVRTLDLRASVPTGVPIDLRLVQIGGGASQIDEVRLGNLTPLGLSKAESKKLIAADRDVMVASGKTFDFKFPPVAEPVLTLGARVEAPKIPHLQFNLPEANRLRGPETGWSFMRYTLGSQALQLKVDGELDEVKGLRPFLHEIRTSATGHGFGDVYTYVGNDAGHLYVVFDFTIDNTVEDDFYPGTDDYAKVYIRYGPAATDLQEFKLRVRDSSWGKTGFAYTDKVGYEHRTYEFRIPWNKITALKKPDTKNLELAFGLFGSASDGDFPIRISYAPVSQRYLVLSGYSQSYNSGEFVHARILNRDGTPLGSPLVITGPTNMYSSNYYSFDGAWDPQNNRFVIVWQQADGTLRGQHLSANGVSGTTFALASGLGADIADLSLARGGNGTWPFQAAIRNNIAGSFYVLPFNATGVTAGTLTVIPKLTAGWPNEMKVVPANDGSYLLVWYETSNIYARHVGADGSLLGNTVQVSTGNFDYFPTAAFDPTRNRFLVAWRSDSNDNVSAALFYPDGNTVSSVFPLYSAGQPSLYPRPMLDWEPMRQRFALAVYLMNETSFRYAELEPADFGFAFGPVTTPTAALSNVAPSLVAAGDSGAALLGWMTYAGGVCCVYDYAVAVTNLPVATVSASDFGTVTVDASAVRELVIGNDGGARSLLPVTAAVDGPFAITTDGCSGSTLAQGATCSLFVTATPSAPGRATGALRLSGGHVMSVTLSVTGVEAGVPDLLLTDPAPPATDNDLAFGYVNGGTSLVRTVNITNEGTADLVIGTIAAAKSDAFAVKSGACSGKTLAPGKTCKMDVTFTPPAMQEYTASVVIPSNDPDAAKTTLTLSGTGVAAGGIAELTAPVLVAPVGGAADVALPAELMYRKALAADGGDVKHTVFVCTDETFVICQGQTAANHAPGGTWGWLAFAAGSLGFVMFRRKAGMAALILAGLTFVSCDDGKKTLKKAPADLVIYVAEDLEGATRYYWKVVAEDQAGRVTQSEVRSFTTK